MLMLFLKLYWKPLIIGTLFTLASAFFYLKGRADAKHSMQIKMNEEIMRRYENYMKAVQRTEEVKNKIIEIRRQSPANDKRDSCLLSTNPLESACL